MLDVLLLVIWNGLGTIPLHVLTTRAKLTPEPGEPDFENEVQDILGLQTRHTKIKCPSVGFGSLGCAKSSLEGLVCR